MRYETLSAVALYFRDRYAGTWNPAIDRAIVERARKVTKNDILDAARKRNLEIRNGRVDTDHSSLAEIHFQLMATIKESL